MTAKAADQPSESGMRGAVGRPPEGESADGGDGSPVTCPEAPEPPDKRPIIGAA